MILDTQLDETQRAFVTKLDFYRTDKQLEEDVTSLMEWMSEQPHLPSVTDKKWLSHFIVGCKYNLHKTKQTIDAYFVTRAEHPEFICTFDLEQVLYNRKNGSNCVFPKLTPEAYRVMCSRMYPTAKDLKLDFLLSFQSYLAILDLQLRIEPMHGEIFLFDLEYLPLSQFVNLPPLMTKNYINMCFNSFPLSVKGFHFINPPKFIGKIMTLAKMLLPKKLKNRIYVHNTLESLYQFIPKDVLPDQYGGTAGDLRSIEDNWFEYTMANNEWLGNRPKADLSKRVGQLKLCELNVKDKFKKLEID